MTRFELIMPKMGESVAEATIIRWLKNEGEKIAIDETILEIATDKVDSEIPSPFEGIMQKKLFNEGDVVQVGSVIAFIGAEVGVETNVAPIKTAEINKNLTAEIFVAEKKDVVILNNYLSTSKFYSPLVKNIAQQEGISIAELEKIVGSGKDGRVTKSDILAFLPIKENKLMNGVKVSNTTNTIEVSSKNGSSDNFISSKSVVSISVDDEIFEMDRMRKLIADHMVMSKHVSPHVTSFVEADVTNLVLWREKNKKTFEKREGEKITFTPCFIEACIKAIKDFPMINVSIDGTKIIKRKNINIGMAAALPSGNLIVPVIKNADQKSLLGLTKSVNELTTKARTNKLAPDDISGGTFTISNVGSFGNVMGTPIINQPQVAILAVGTIKKKPAVIETEFGDLIGIRHMMFLSLSYDHRWVDGALGGSFLRRIGDYLEQWDVTREI